MSLGGITDHDGRAICAMRMILNDIELHLIFFVICSNAVRVQCCYVYWFGSKIILKNTDKQ
jgi:hypothetical protein